MLLATLLLTLPQAWLDEHVAQADCIVLGRVVDVREVSQSPPRVDARTWPSPTVPVAEIEVRRMLLGDPTATRVFATAARVREGELEPVLLPGDTGVFFLDRDRRLWLAANERTRSLLSAATAGSQLFALRQEGAYLEHGTPDTEALVAQIDRDLDRITPSLSLNLVTTGPFSWRARVEADGRWHVDRTGDAGEAIATDGELHGEDLERYRLALDVEHFVALPPNVGRSLSPDSGSLRFALRSRSGVTRVTLYRRGERTPEEGAAREHLRRIVEALPGDTSLVESFFQ